MNTRAVFRSIGNFLFSRANREMLIFLFFFAVASVFWLLTALNDDYEREVKMLVRYVNVPKNVVLTSPETDTLRLTINDRGINIVGLVYGHSRHIIDIDFERYTHGDGTGSVSSSDLQKLVVQELPTSAKLISTKPEKITFYYNNGERKRVPVRIKGQVIPEKIYFISDTIIRPDSVTIYARRSMLDSIDAVYTQVLNYTDFNDTLSIQSALKATAGVKMVPSTVHLMFVTDVLTEEHIDGIPIVGINMPEGKRLRTFPARVTVNFVGGMKDIQEISAADFLVTADYNEFSRQQSPKCNIYLQRWPSSVSRPKLSISQVDYLIEEQQGL